MNPLTRVERFDDFLPDMFRRMTRPLMLASEAPQDIRIDMVEKDHEYQVSAELPGVRKEDLRVTVDGNQVSISAEVHQQREEKEAGRLLLKETYDGSVSRGFSLAHDIDAAKVTARLKDGVLHLTLPKSEASRSRLVTIE